MHESQGQQKRQEVRRRHYHQRLCFTPAHRLLKSHERLNRIRVLVAHEYVSSGPVLYEIM